MARRKIGVALAGGGPLGAIWEVGSLVALDEALNGLDLANCDMFVGVSSGAFIAAGLANGITPRGMYQIFIKSEGDDPFEPDLLLRPAIGEYVSRARSLPRLIASAAKRYFETPSSKGFFETFQELSRALPTGIFDSSPMSDYLARILSDTDRTNDFRKLRRQLFLVATDLDRNEVVAFGTPGWDTVPISRAIQASAALPGLFPPVKIHDRYFVDGVLMKTLHASVALKQGAELLFCVNPLVPFISETAARGVHEKRTSIVAGGLPAVMSQTLRSMIYSRMQVAMGRYGHEFPNADVLLFEPRRDDAEMFFTNVFSYAQRRRLSEHAYQATRADLRNRFDELAPILARHGIELDRSVLTDPTRRLNASGKRLEDRSPQALKLATSKLEQTLDELDNCLEGAGRLRRRTKRPSRESSAHLPDGAVLRRTE
ncbi:patatin-like phospholipase family protein [Microvirga alba]|uniref:Patatin-like phospholipase family protein n=1 Tax=Microvirga alba TaxID=2791025 RepID=A0A931FRG2_9HYPH|nr:patatin-like phospholipase family protein [Microvirga alba]MBF9234518.1 patatin-like phospholipase family protein [Microvirga alba]